MCIKHYINMPTLTLGYLIFSTKYSLKDNVAHWWKLEQVRKVIGKFNRTLTLESSYKQEASTQVQ